jgi:hypothetical protein
MPEEVAHKILGKYITNHSSIATGLNLHPSMALASPLIYKMCDDKSTRIYSWNAMKIEQFDSFSKRVIVRSEEKISGKLSCFDLGAPYYVGTIDTPSKEEMDDVIDALVSLGVKIDVKNK